MIRTLFRLLVTSILLFAVAAWGQAPTSETSAVWQALLRPAFASGKAYAVSNVALIRDRIKITLISGTIQFAEPVNGRVFAAAFRGSGRLEVVPPNPIEAQQLRLFLKQDAIDFHFSDATFCFTDKTFEEVGAQAQAGSAAGPELGSLYLERQQQRESVGFELLPRLYKSVLSTDRAGTALFAADLKTSEKGWMHLRDDALDPEEITVAHWVGSGALRDTDTWMSFPAGGRSSSDAYADPFAKEDFHILGYQIDAAVTSGAELSATTKVKVESRLAGERVWVFRLNSNLRVERITDEQGKPLEFVQPRERKDDTVSSGEYVAVVFPAPTEKGRVQTLEFRYAGKRVVRQEGPGTYFCPSSGWYPARRDSFASRADFELNFRSPKRFSLVATGNKISETVDGDSLITTWKSDIPLAVAGFAYGDYKLYSEKVGNIDVEVFANREPDDFMKSIQVASESPLPGTLGTRSGPSMPLGTLSPSSLAKQMGTEMGNTLRVFEQYFGPYPYKQLAISNIPYSYGQGWPGLIYLSALSFLDSTQRNALGLREHVGITDFFRAHESSHQWWGHRVGWKSYHDQWMSEGFAEFSGNLYVQYRKNGKEYLSRLRMDKEALGARDLHNRPYESIGPVWMGLRLSSSDSPDGYNTVVYKKGGWVLHMLRMMLYDPRNPDPDHRFKETMQDFCKTFDNKAASTEDFKAILEKHMTPSMDLEGNHRMDWFFREYVYGTGIPQYEFRYAIEDVGSGQWKVSGNVVRNGVPDGWKDILPIYLHRGNTSARLGFINVTQANAPFNFVLGFKPDKLSLNDNEDILADIKQ